MDRSNNKFPPIAKPAFIGDFGTQYSPYRIVPGRSKLRYFYEKALKEDIKRDLKDGFYLFITKPEVDEKLDGLLNYILLMSEPKSNLRKIVHEADFVTWRGTLTRVGSSPYDTVDSSTGWKIACVKFHGVIFLCEYATDLKRMKAATENEFQRIQTFGGFKLEQWLTTENKGEQPNTSVPVSTCENYSAVFKLEIGDKRAGNHVGIFMGAEVDGIGEDGRFIEIKSQFKAIGNGRFWPSKEMKWWLQSFLAGVERLIVGIKDANSYVRTVKELKNSEFVRSRSGGWDPAVCINTILTYLNEVRQRLNAVPEGTIILTEQIPQKPWTIKELSLSEDRLAYDFLLPKFIHHFNL
ncbi:Decapping nuclease [Aphelenchoides fujianensis]|nr:Decapping nuclease [Aphelenchoides fujianensis]